MYNLETTLLSDSTGIGVSTVEPVEKPVEVLTAVNEPLQLKKGLKSVLKTDDQGNLIRLHCKKSVKLTHKPHRIIPMHNFIRSPLFERIMATVTALHFGYIAVETEVWSKSDARFEVYPCSTRLWIALVLINSAFSCIYFVEIVLGLVYQGTSYFMKSEVQFNIIMAIISWLSDVFGWLACYTQNDTARDITQVIGAFRVLRVIRLIGNPFGIIVVARGFLFSLVSLAWIAVFLVILLFAFANLATRYFQGVLTQVASEEMVFRWGSLSSALYTLFLMLTFDGWSDIAMETQDFFPWSPIFFVAYIASTGVVLLSIVTSVMVDAYINASKALRIEEKYLSALEKENQVADKIRQLIIESNALALTPDHACRGNYLKQKASSEFEIEPENIANINTVSHDSTVLDYKHYGSKTGQVMFCGKKANIHCRPSWQFVQKNNVGDYSDPETSGCPSRFSSETSVSYHVDEGNKLREQWVSSTRRIQLSSSMTSSSTASYKISNDSGESSLMTTVYPALYVEDEDAVAGTGMGAMLQGHSEFSFDLKEVSISSEANGIDSEKSRDTARRLDTSSPKSSSNISSVAIPTISGNTLSSGEKRQDDIRLQLKGRTANDIVEALTPAFTTVGISKEEVKDAIQIMKDFAIEDASAIDVAEACNWVGSTDSSGRQLLVAKVENRTYMNTMQKKIHELEHTAAETEKLVVKLYRRLATSRKRQRRLQGERNTRNGS